MKELKLLLGWFCLMVAISLGTVVVFLALSNNYDGPRDLPLTISVAWFACTGMFLLVRRDIAPSRAVRIRFVVNLFLCVAFFVYAAIPSFTHGHGCSCANACVNNLRQIDAAANQFALEHHLTNGAPIHFPDDLKPYIRLNSQGKIPSCPDGGIYHLSRVGDSPTCSLGNTVTPGHYLP